MKQRTFWCDPPRCCDWTFLSFKL